MFTKLSVNDNRKLQILPYKPYKLMYDQNLNK